MTSHINLHVCSPFPSSVSGPRGLRLRHCTLHAETRLLSCYWCMRDGLNSAHFSGDGWAKNSPAPFLSLGLWSLCAAINVDEARPNFYRKFLLWGALIFIILESLPPSSGLFPCVVQNTPPEHVASKLQTAVWEGSEHTDSRPGHPRKFAFNPLPSIWAGGRAAVL